MFEGAWRHWYVFLRESPKPRIPDWDRAVYLLVPSKWSLFWIMVESNLPATATDHHPENLNGEADSPCRQAFPIVLKLEGRVVCGHVRQSSQPTATRTTPEGLSVVPEMGFLHTIKMSLPVPISSSGWPPSPYIHNQFTTDRF